ncbi:MAG: methionyl-tRNA formyltransferase [Pseudomonadota bacterium]
MKIIVNGQQAFGKAVLEELLNRGEDVAAVYCAPDTEGRPLDPLKSFALEKGLPVHQPNSFRKEEVWAQMRDIAPDLCVMAYVTKFVPEEALNIPRLGTIQYHPSLLPMHKGPSSINWPIIFGSNKTGLSIFWPDNGLDTGPILMQKEVDIGPDDTLGSIYFNHLFPMGVEAMIESVDLVRDGKAPKVAQDPDAGTYEGWCNAEDAEINWSDSTDKVYNLIRGTNPQPGAWTTHSGQTLQIFDSAKVDGAGGAPGEIVGSDENGMVVATSDGYIQVQRVRPKGDGKIAASEFMTKNGVDVGTKLG